MHKIKHLWPQVVDAGNISRAIDMSSIGKRNRRDVKKVLANKGRYICLAQEMLTNHTFQPVLGSELTVYDKTARKTRIIHRPRYWPDQVMHWALMQPLAPILQRSLYQYSCGSIPGRGTHCAVKYLKHALRNNYIGTKYCLKFDISKYYSSIPPELMDAEMGRRIADKDVLWLLRAFISLGIKIGYYTSQWLANIYLARTDWWIKQDLGAPYYIRYIDDFVILGPNKRKLHKLRAELFDHLHNELRLNIKGDWQLFKVGGNDLRGKPVNGRGIDFLGYVFYHGYTLLRKRTALRIMRRSGKIVRRGASNVQYADAAAMMSYLGILKHCDSHGLTKKYIYEPLSVAKMKGVISNEGKIRAAACGGFYD